MLKQAMDAQTAEVQKIKAEMTAKMSRQQQLAAKAEEAANKQAELQKQIEVTWMISYTTRFGVHQLCLGSHIVARTLILLHT